MIYEILPLGVEDGVTADYLVDAFNLDNSRELRKQINVERMSGKPILNKGNKYFRSDNPKDYISWYRTTYRKGKSTIDVANAVLKQMPEEDGQIKISDYIRTCDEERLS